MTEPEIRRGSGESVVDGDALKSEGLKIYFNPFAFTVEQNNAFIAKGYEPMPMRIPDAD